MLERYSRCRVSLQKAKMKILLIWKSHINTPINPFNFIHTQTFLDPKIARWNCLWMVSDIFFQRIYVVWWVGSGPVMIYRAVQLIQIFLVCGRTNRRRCSKRSSRTKKKLSQLFMSGKKVPTCPIQAVNPPWLVWIFWEGDSCERSVGRVRHLWSPIVFSQLR